MEMLKVITLAEGELSECCYSGASGEELGFSVVACHGDMRCGPLGDAKFINIK